MCYTDRRQHEEGSAGRGWWLSRRLKGKQRDRDSRVRVVGEIRWNTVWGSGNFATLVQILCCQAPGAFAALVCYLSPELDDVCWAVIVAQSWFEVLGLSAVCSWGKVLLRTLVFLELCILCGLEVRGVKTHIGCCLLFVAEGVSHKMVFLAKTVLRWIMCQYR